MVRKLTQDEVIQQFRHKHGDKYLYDRVKYINEKTKVWIGCKTEGHGYFEQTPNNHKMGNGCPTCSGNKSLAFEDIKLLYETDTIKILDTETRECGNKGNKYKCIKYKCLLDDYEGWVILDNVKDGIKCPACYDTNKLSIDIIKQRLNKINPNIEILDKNYVNRTTKLKCKCLIDNHIWSAPWTILKNGTGCPRCANNILHDGNRVSYARPDLIKYFANIDDIYIYAINSNNNVQLKCPECGMLKSKLTTVNKLSNRGFKCEYCFNHNISIPEKFGINLFKQLEIKFGTQKIFDWAKDKRYDMYFVLNNEEYICEIHGEQHYYQQRENSKFKMTLEEQQENDLLKYNLAIQNGIKPQNYIIIDARCSTFKWLKENYIKELSIHFNLSCIDWDFIWEMCQRTTIVDVWDAWNNRNKLTDSTVTLSNIFFISKSTIIRYLKRGNEIGKCVYDGKEESRKAGGIYKKQPVKQVHQYNLQKEYIQSFKSVTEARRSLNINNISACCHGKVKSAGGFIWSYSLLNSNIICLEV